MNSYQDSYEDIRKNIQDSGKYPENNINPVYFMKDKIYKSEDVGTVLITPIQKVEPMPNDNNIDFKASMVKDYIIGNVTDLCNTFMIRLLEKYVDKDEIAYIIDFTDRFDMKKYLGDRIRSLSFTNSYLELYSVVLFILNQFLQFYTMTKLVYRKEGVELYNTLYKLAYSEEPTNTNIDYQTKYVFCMSILQNALEFEAPAIFECCVSMNTNIYNIGVKLGIFGIGYLQK